MTQEKTKGSVEEYQTARKLTAWNECGFLSHLFSFPFLFLQERKVQMMLLIGNIPAARPEEEEEEEEEMDVNSYFDARGCFARRELVNAPENADELIADYC